MARKVLHILTVMFAAQILSFAGTARAGVVVGASFGYTHLSYHVFDDLDNVGQDAIGFPGAQQWGQPGLRVGYVAPNRRWDVNTDIGLVHISSGELGHQTTLQLQPQLQVNGRERNGYCPFVNAAAGIVYDSVPVSFDESRSVTRPVVGAGLGMRKSVSEGHGLIRVELRYDHKPKHEIDEPQGAFIFPGTDMYSVKFGFDLFVAQ